MFSGTNESDVAAKVLDRIWADERGGLYDEGSGNDESESEGEAADEESSGFEKKDGERESLGAAATEERMEGWRPLYWWVFLLYGPYGAAKFACDVHSLLSINVNTYILEVMVAMLNVKELGHKKNWRGRPHRVEGTPKLLIFLLHFKMMK